MNDNKLNITAINSVKRISITLILILILNYSYSQESLNSAGGDKNGIGGSVSFSIGQILNSNSLESGVQHSYEIFPIGILDKDYEVKLYIYPNPISNILNLEYKDLKGEQYKYQLNDINGKLIYSQIVSNNNTSINTSILPSGTYFLVVLNEQDYIIKTFKVIKH
jgi:hypothetical protein